jgi:hypothetical protein
MRFMNLISLTCQIPSQISPVNTRLLNLPLPWRERIEVRGSSDKLRMTFLFAMVSLSNHHPHPDPLPSREREIFVRAVIGGKRGIFHGASTRGRIT